MELTTMSRAASRHASTTPAVSTEAGRGRLCSALTVMPPSTASVCPVTYAALSEPRNRTVSATSSAVPSLPSGTRPWRSLRASGSALIASDMPALISPGATALTRTPAVPHSSAMCSVNMITAALEAV